MFWSHWWILRKSFNTKSQPSFTHAKIQTKSKIASDDINSVKPTWEDHKMYVNQMKLEHEEMASLTERFATDLSLFVDHHAAAESPLIESILKFVEVQEMHMAEEESQFLPLAMKLLPEARFAEIDDAIQRDLITENARQTFSKIAKIDSKIDSIVAKGE